MAKMAINCSLEVKDVIQVHQAMFHIGFQASEPSDSEEEAFEYFSLYIYFCGSAQEPPGIQPL